MNHGLRRVTGAPDVVGGVASQSGSGGSEFRPAGIDRPAIIAGDIVREKELTRDGHLRLVEVDCPAVARARAPADPDVEELDVGGMKSQCAAIAGPASGEDEIAQGRTRTVEVDAAATADTRDPPLVDREASDLSGRALSTGKVKGAVEILGINRGSAGAGNAHDQDVQPSQPDAAVTDAPVGTGSAKDGITTGGMINRGLDVEEVPAAVRVYPNDSSARRASDDTEDDRKER
ncbi:hypothetical protein FJ251_01555 [bacterium]|nr:hypothetical protein [bacterium]